MLKSLASRSMLRSRANIGDPPHPTSSVLVLPLPHNDLVRLHHGFIGGGAGDCIVGVSVDLGVDVWGFPFPWFASCSPICHRAGLLGWFVVRL